MKNKLMKDHNGKISVQTKKSIFPGKKVKFPDFSTFFRFSRYATVLGLYRTPIWRQRTSLPICSEPSLTLRSFSFSIASLSLFKIAQLGEFAEARLCKVVISCSSCFFSRRVFTDRLPYSLKSEPQLVM